MIIVLDSNEYINYLSKKSAGMTDFSSEKLFLDKNLSIAINDHIIREVLRNISEIQKKEFYRIISKDNINFYGELLPIHLLDKYKNLKLKKGDIAIAGFCENISAEYLISENRHFLKGIKNTKFKIINAKEFVKKVLRE